VQVAEWVFTGFGREGERVCPEGRPRRLVGEVRHDLVGSAVEHLHGLGSDDLFGCDVEAVAVALDRLEKPGRWVVELAQQGAGGDGRYIAGEDLLQRFGQAGQRTATRSMSSSAHRELAPQALYRWPY
jgi:hypothetical protein